MSAGVQVVFCDIGDVLVHTAPLIRAAAHAAAHACQADGYAVDPQALERSYLACDQTATRPHINHLFGDMEVALAATATLLGEPDLLCAGTFLTHYRAYIRRHIAPNEEITLFFRSLADIPSLKVGIISDGTVDEQIETLARLKIAHYLDPRIVLISQAFGAEKTEAGIFREALRRAGALPHHAVMVGDNLDVDVEVPMSIGMRAIFFSKYAGTAALSRSGAAPDAVCASFPELLSAIIRLR